MQIRGRLGEHDIRVGNHDAKRSGFQLIECSPNLPANSGALVNILSYDVSKMFDCGPEPCDTKMYAFHSFKLILVLGKFKATVES
ncbi:unnamed protein product [Pocillopora meandrina]|uniref:Uncharacterized protein n=1 Tax=Pocillopora meandrina TaxID=46732 RepID=A0AAU9WHT3_9CNID|nr:unnamed protein product [Pocillopora meandrina]